jgi:hypothetical protein
MPPISSEIPRPEAWFLSLEFHFVKLRKIKTAGWQGGQLQWLHKFFAKQKTYSSKMARRPFLSSARDRSGILFCRRQKRYKRIARFFAAEPQKMRPDG